MPAVPRSKRDLERLALQARACFDREAQALATVGLPREGRALDVGCAAGHFAALLRQRHPRLAVHGINFDGGPIPDQVTERATRNLSEYAVSPELPQGPFDLVYTRFHLRHTPEPEDLVAAMRGVAAPGGLVAAIETDDGALRTFPEVAGLRQALDGIHTRYSMVDPFVGLRLRDLFLRAELRDVRVVPIVVCSEDIGTDVFVQLLAPFLDGGRNGLPADQLKTVVDGVEAWRTHPGAFASWTFYCVGGRVGWH